MIKKDLRCRPGYRHAGPSSEDKKFQLTIVGKGEPVDGVQSGERYSLIDW